MRLRPVPEQEEAHEAFVALLDAVYEIPKIHRSPDLQAALDRIQELAKEAEDECERS